VHLSDFDYDLPPELIAQEPTTDREASRLLTLDRRTGATAHHRFTALPTFLRPGDLLVVNRSRVFPARVLGRRKGGGDAEILLVRQTGPVAWEAMLRPARRLRPGDRIDCAGGLTIVVTSGPTAADGRREVRFECEPADVARLLAEVGQTPLPPYIRRAPGPADLERYQTVYARDSGSVAAPTAGLHFTPHLLDRIRASGVEVAEVILHVGPGTFRPVQVDDVRDHRVAPEPYVVPTETAEAVARTRLRGGRIVAVGTTTVRTLETAAGAGGLSPGAGETDLVIVPGYTFHVVDALVTNFHIPKSSLLLLVCAFAGTDSVLSAYREAVMLGYRFYSYGDAMFIAGGE
jgi:S-adenosylmethionine:tRNA ribosyltransferase-isomerase